MATASYITFQNSDIPCAFVSALSYSKNARLTQTTKGYNRSHGLEPAEISLRLFINYGICETIGVDYNYYLTLLNSLIPSKDSIPTNFYINGFPLYSSLLFALSSINKTTNIDESGTIYEAEFDLVLSGVSCTKEESRQRALIFNNNSDLIIPKITLLCNGKEKIIESDLSILSLSLTAKGGVIEIGIGEGLKEVERNWMTDLLDHQAQIKIENYNTYNIISGILLDDILSLEFSVFDIEYNKSIQKSFTNVSLKDLFPEFIDNTEIIINYLIFSGNQIEMLSALQKSLGFVVDYTSKRFELAPDELKSNNTFNYYYDSDLVNENITKLLWRDGVHTFEAGNSDGAVYQVESICTVNNSNISSKYLKYIKLFQNEIIITAPIDQTIREHSVINIIKNNVQIPCIVSDYELNFINNEMKLTLNYIS